MVLDYRYKGNCFHVHHFLFLTLFKEIRVFGPPHQIHKGICIFTQIFKITVFSLHNFFKGVCAVNGLLYVVGGDDGSCNLASVEYYNPTTDKWTVVSSCMSTGRSYAGNKCPIFLQSSYSLLLDGKNTSS